MHEAVERSVLKAVRGVSAAAVIVAAIFSLLATAVLTQWSEVVLGIAAGAEFAIGLPVATVLALLMGLGILAGLTRTRLLSREEVICVYFILAIATPLMTQGFWQRVVSISVTIPRGADMEKYDFISPKLWAHGANLLANAFGRAEEGARETEGNVTMEDGDLPGGMVVLTGERAGGTVRARFRVPPGVLVPGEEIFAGLLVRLSGLEGDSHYTAGFCDKASGSFLPVAGGRSAGRYNPVLPRGFARVGKYGVRVPESSRLWFEVTLYGKGRLEAAGLQMFSVEAVEALYSGLQTAENVESVLLAQRPRTLIAPEGGGVAWLLEKLGLATVPWRSWALPVAGWGSFAGLVLLGSFGLNMLMRNRWVDGERVPLPLTRIPLMMTGLPFQANEEPVKFWLNRVMWVGFAVAFVWAGLQGWHFYNPEIPNLEIRIPLKPYFEAGWGRTWDIAFSVGVIILALAVFIESGMLLSAVAGFLIFRLLFFAGEVTGWDSLPKYPYASYQQIGGFVAYAAVLAYAARRQVMREIRIPGQGGRAGLGMILAAAVGMAAWAVWMELPVWQMLALLAFLLIVAMVAARFRVESGTPVGYFTPINAGYLFFICGGFGVFASDFLLFSYAMSFVFLSAVFFLIPGAQMEFLEIGRRLKIPSRHVWGGTALGVIGGIVIGGWIFLLVGYSFGAGSVRNDWAFTQKAWFFAEYTAEMARAGAESHGGRNVEEWLAMGYGAGGTVLLAVLRQVIMGFWFHPFGFIVGSTPFAQDLWGTLLVAWLIRSVSLKVGGVRTLRHGLQPFFGGMFLGGVTAWLVSVVIGTMVSQQGAEMIYQRLP